MSAKRVLVTGIQTYWGYRVARALEERPEIEAIVGVAPEDPLGELERAEYVKVGAQHALLRRIVDAARIDTVIDTRLVVDSTTTSPRLAHENNVIGTMNILAACSGRETTVRKFIFKSSTHYYGCEQDDPAFFTESMRRPHPPRTAIERDIVEAEAAVTDFASKQPDTCATILRCANVLGPDVDTGFRAFVSLPVVAGILGFDPRFQGVHEDDVAGALLHAAEHELPGTFNVAADGVLALSEVADLLGKPFVPLLPPFGTGLATAPLRRLGVRIPPEMMNQLRFGRGVDNRRLKASGYAYRYTTRETVLKLGEHLRLSGILKNAREPYRYERDVEEFLRRSPAVHNRTTATAPAPATPNPAAEPPTEPKPRERAIPTGTPATPEPKPTPDHAPRAGGRDGGVGGRPPGDRSETAVVGQAPPAERSVPSLESSAAPVHPRLAAPQPEPPEPLLPDYEDLEAEEIISLLGSLTRPDLEALRDLERGSRARPSVLGAIESVLARVPA